MTEAIDTTGYNDAEFHDGKDPHAGLLKCPVCLGEAQGGPYTCSDCWIDDKIEKAEEWIRTELKKLYYHLGGAAESRPYLWAYGKMLRSKSGATTPAQPTQRIEKPCRTCQRPNDVGVKSCWCCGGVPH